MSRSIFNVAISLSFFLNSSCSGFKCPLPGNAFFASVRYFFFQLNKVFLLKPKSEAILSTDLPDSNTSLTAETLKSLSKLLRACLSDIVAPIFFYFFINIVAFLIVYNLGYSSGSDYFGIGIKSANESDIDHFTSYIYPIRMRIYYRGNVEISQLDKDNLQFGQIEYWNATYWDPKNVPATLFKTGNVTLKSYQDFKDGTSQKYKEWLDQTDVVNFNTFPITANVVNFFDAKFDQAYQSPKVKNHFLDYSDMNPSTDKIWFKNPWLKDELVPLYGGRNQGISGGSIGEPGADWHQLDSPVDFSIANFSDYKGVFLGQSGFPSWNPPYYSVKADAVQDVNIISTGIPTGRTHKFYFQNWSAYPVNSATFKNEYLLETPVVFNQDGATVRANLKGTQLTRSQFTDKRSGQRGFIKDNWNGYLHNVYESYGQIFYERSMDNGATWVLMNNGKPLNTWGLAKSPSICVNDGRYLLYIVYQNDDFLNYGLIVTQYELTEYANTPNWSHSICAMEDFNNSNDYQPVIASLATMCVVVCNPPSTSTAGLRAFNIYTNSSNNSYDHCSEFSLPNVDQNSSNPSIAASGTRFHLVYEQSQTSIRYYAWSGGAAVSSVVSSGSSTIFNLKPVISLLYGQCPIVSWVGATYNYLGGYYPTNVLTRVGSSSGSFTGAINSVNGQVQVVSNASNMLPQQKTLITWSYYNGSSYQSKWQRRDNTSTPTYTAPALMKNGAWNIHGIWTQATTDVNFLSPKALVFNNGIPYYFISSTTDFIGGAPQQEGSISGNSSGNIYLGKITEDDTILTFGRSGVASINDIEFVFEIGDIIVGDSIIRFIEIPDTLVYPSTNELNQHTRTNNFTLSPETNFYFSNIYHVVQKSNPDSALTISDAVNFRAELVNALTNQVVGTFDNITYNKNNLEKYASIDYEVDCSGITPGAYYLRLVSNVIGNANYTLTNIFNDNTTLAKKNFNKVNFTGSEIPITYDLD